MVQYTHHTMNNNSATPLKFLFVAVLFLGALWGGGVGALRTPASSLSRVAASVPDVISSTLAVTSGPVSDVVSEGMTTESAVLELPPEVGAAVVAIEELTNGERVVSKDTFMRRPIASLTKLMTAVVAQEYFSPDKEITFTDAAIAQEGAAGGFAKDERFSAHDLIAAALAVSSNDAAYALAGTRSESAADPNPHTISESANVEGFVNAMNEKAHMLGMSETHFEDATGLSPLNQSTAEDLSRLARYLWAYQPSLLKRTAAPSIAIREHTSGGRRILKNINFFAGRDEFLGGKTGFIDESSGNLVSVWQHENKVYLIIVLGTEDRFGDTERLWWWITAP